MPSFTPEAMSAADLAAFWQENDACKRAPAGAVARVPLFWMFEESFLFGMLPDVDCGRYYADPGLPPSTA